MMKVTMENVQQAAKLYKIRASAKKLFGSQYEERVAFYKEYILKVSKATEKDFLTSAIGHGQSSERA
jgi:hypothetical protein